MSLGSHPSSANIPWYFHEIGDDHFHEDEAWSLETDGLWVSDHFELKSVGVDIGSASTQVVFSRLALERLGGDLSSRYHVVERESLYRSSIWLTPYVGTHRIDEQQLERMITAAYKDAGLTPQQVDTGAVILTGEAIRRENAEAIAHMLARQGGRFVCAIAGHNMEALLAAHGSGTVERSRRDRSRLLNIDIGGGTTKLSVVDSGRVVETAALHIGGRLLATDNEGVLRRLEPPIQRVAEKLGLALQVGKPVSATVKDKLGAWYAARLMAALKPTQATIEDDELYLTSKLVHRAPFDGVVVSGGVGEFVYALTDEDFGDLGRYLGSSVRRELEANKIGPLVHLGECLRATVVGASEYSLQVSGNTIHLSSPNVLPLRNAPVLHPPCDLHHEIDATIVGAQICHHLEKFDVKQGQSDFVLSFHFAGLPDYKRLRALCEGIFMGLSNAMHGPRQVTLLFDKDIARSVGRILEDEIHVSCPLLILDGIHLHDFDYIDIGRLIEPAGVVPVTIKSLVFQLVDGWDIPVARDLN